MLFSVPSTIFLLKNSLSGVRPTRIRKIGFSHDKNPSFMAVRLKFIHQAETFKWVKLYAVNGDWVMILLHCFVSCGEFSA
jgi:hypothetical protein